MNGAKNIFTLLFLCSLCLMFNAHSKGGKGKQPQQLTVTKEAASTSAQPASPVPHAKQDITQLTTSSLENTDQHIESHPASPTTKTEIVNAEDDDGELLEQEESSEEFPPSLTDTVSKSVQTAVSSFAHQVVVTVGGTASSVGTVLGNTLADASTKAYKNIIGHDSYCLAGIESGELSTVLQDDRIRAQHDLEHALSLLKKQLAYQLNKKQWEDNKSERSKTKMLLAGWSTIIAFYNTNKAMLTLDPKIIEESDHLISSAITILVTRKKNTHAATFSYFAQLLRTNSNAHELSGAQQSSSSLLPSTQDNLYIELFGNKPAENQLIYSPQSQD